jgi:hypothetical protein
MSRRALWSVPTGHCNPEPQKVERAEDGGDPPLEKRSRPGGKISEVVSRALEPNGFDLYWMCQPGIEPSLQKSQQGFLIGFAFDEQNDAHERVSASPEKQNFPRE